MRLSTTGITFGRPASLAAGNPGLDYLSAVDSSICSGGRSKAHIGRTRCSYSSYELERQFGPRHLWQLVSPLRRPHLDVAQHILSGLQRS